MSKNANIAKIQRAAELYVSGMKGKDIAVKLGVSDETVSRWRRTAEFIAHENFLLEEISQNIKHRIGGLADKSLNIINDYFSNSDVKIQDKVCAALKILKMIGNNSVQLNYGSTSVSELKNTDWNLL